MNVSKELQFYTLYYDFGNFTVIGVKSQRGSDKDGIYYGHNMEDRVNTHKRIDECIGKFNTYKDAISCVDTIKLLYKEYREELNRRRREIDLLIVERTERVNLFIQHYYEGRHAS